MFDSVLKDIAESNGLTNYEINYNTDRTATEGYVGKIAEVKIISGNKTLNLIIKSCGVDDKVRNIFPMKVIFERKTYMYKNVFPLFKRFESEHGVEPLQLAPIFFNSCNNHEGDAIILDNLNKSGFSMYPKKEFLDESHLRLVIDQYARFHSISLACKDQEPIKYKTLTENLDDHYLEILKTGFVNVFVKLLRKAEPSLDCESDEHLKTGFNKYIAQLEEYFNKIPSLTDEFSVIVDGDCWINNMMFKYGDKKDSSLPTEVRMVDFQASRQSSPMLDLVNVFYACSPKEALDNYGIYMDFYYERLSAHVETLGSRVKIMYPHDVMLEHWKKFAPYGLAIRASILNVMFSDQTQHKGFSDKLEVDSELLNVFDFQISDWAEYCDHSKHTIRHFVENGFI